ncbi:TnsA endonuclease N-terminal domain-containing protein [Pseudoalteromonas sp. APC 3694]|uniref:TnsA endonuclease N-terminal domain-containing protein n=1 Tax=Pseudoalteromonas sp. APC 3694 TaxID=3035202 RepID=UPI0025B398B1|nr:TnsA endonuclease N-terminal domain-containing protein [Pseudoalteromonas sp. APC 3694]MDN3490737.1 hypothetical protein [Pseudoalteromonas sp. APC 3694]
MSVDRKFGKANTHKPDIKHFSPKLRAMVSCDSYLEKKKCLVLDLNPNVISYMTQPDSTYYEFNGAICRYTPDKLVKTNNGYEFWEIKPFAKTLNDEFKHKNKVLKTHYCEVLKVPLKVVTEEGMTKREFISNCQVLSDYIYHYQDEDITNHILNDLLNMTNPRVLDAEVIAIEYGQSPDYVWSMLAHKKLRFDHDLLIDRSTQLLM